MAYWGVFGVLRGPCIDSPLFVACCGSVSMYCFHYAVFKDVTEATGHLSNTKYCFLCYSELNLCKLPKSFLYNTVAHETSVSAEVKKMWIYTSILPDAFMAWCVID
jgi:hypothetical protein